MGVSLKFFWKDLFDPAHMTVGQTDLDTVGVKCGTCQKVLYKTLGQFSASLVLFEYDQHMGANRHIFPFSSVHFLSSLLFLIIVS